jgi:hypothetical protein
LFFTVGLPRSGKSTYCDFWVQETPIYEWPDGSRQTFRPRAIVSGDDLRKAIHGHAYLPLSEPLVFSHMDVMTRTLLNRGFDVIIDETCTTEETLLRYLRIDIEASPVFIDVWGDVCVRRAIATGKSYLVGPIQRMSEQMLTLRANWDATFASLREKVKARKEQDVATCLGSL